MKVLPFILIFLFLLIPLSAYSYIGDACDVFPVFFGTDNAGPDNGIIVFRDQNAGAWQAPRTIDTDLLDSQWLPQRNAVGWDSVGKWNVSFIEATGNDLEVWESADDGWQDDAGAWAMTDSDATYNYLACDVESRQDYVHGMAFNGISVYGWYIELVTANAIVPYLIRAATDYQFSLVMNKQLLPWHTGVLRDNVDASLVADNAYNLGYQYIDTGIAGEYPQVVTDASNFFWMFYTNTNTLNCRTWTSTWDVGTTFSEPVGFTAVYAANTLTANYHATWLAMDDTIHVVLVDWNIGDTMTYLIYVRRTPNGWSAPVTLLTVDSNPIGGKDSLEWPQITVDAIGNIVIYYIRADDWTVTRAGDLRAFYLDSSLYSGFANPANWVSYTDVDQTENLVEWCVAPDYQPISGDF